MKWLKAAVFRNWKSSTLAPPIGGIENGIDYADQNTSFIKEETTFKCNDLKNKSPSNSPILFFYLEVCDRSRSPQWNEAFCFLVRDPSEEMLIVKASTLPVLQCNK